MNRTERLTALLLLLQSRRERLTARQIAEHFGTCRRTALRDMAAIIAMGVPVESSEGADGGYSLPADYQIASLPLNVREAMLLLLALSGLEKMTAAPFGAARETLSSKLRALLSPAHRAAADALLSHVSLDIPDRSRHPVPFLDTLFLAVQNQTWLQVSYRSEKGGLSERMLLPVRLNASGGFWYCEAHTHERNGERRTYRVDRFEAITPCPAPPDALPSEPPSYHAPEHPEVYAELTARGVALVEREPHLGQSVHRAADGAGYVRFRCPPHELEWYAGYFFRLGTEATVYTPTELRARIHRLAAEIVARYIER